MRGFFLIGVPMSNKLFVARRYFFSAFGLMRIFAGILPICVTWYVICTFLLDMTKYQEEAYFIALVGIVFSAFCITDGIATIIRCLLKGQFPSLVKICSIYQKARPWSYMFPGYCLFLLSCITMWNDLGGEVFIISAPVILMGISFCIIESLLSNEQSKHYLKGRMCQYLE